MLFAKYTRPNAGYSYDRERCKNLLKLDCYYVVNDVFMGSCYTDIALKGFNGTFNSVNFTFYVKDSKGIFKEHDIFNDPKYNPYL